MITCDKQHNIGGNILSLLYGNSFNGQTDTTDGMYATFLKLFYNDTELIRASELVLPSSVVGRSYQQMFYGCTSLTTAPTLPATTLTVYCYQGMFANCTSLNEITSYANDISASECIYYWVNGVAASGTFHNLGSAVYSTGISGIPEGWTEVHS